MSDRAARNWPVMALLFISGISALTGMWTGQLQLLLLAVVLVLWGILSKLIDVSESLHDISIQSRDGGESHG